LEGPTQVVELFYIRSRHQKDKRTGEKKSKGYATFAGVTAPSHEALFEDIETYLDKIPEEERYNVYYTANLCDGTGQRNFEKNSCVWFDIDNIDHERSSEYVDAFYDFFQLDRTKTVLVYSGNGLQFLIKRLDDRHDKAFFTKSRKAYKKCCEMLTDYLNSKNLIITEKETGKLTEVDVIWDASRLLRFPLTENRKPGRSTKRATLANRMLISQDMGINVLSDSDKVNKENKDLKDHYLDWEEAKVDEEFILSDRGCAAVRSFCSSMGNVSEPKWYKALSILGRFEKGLESAKHYSSGHPDYNPSITEQKTFQAVTRSGPRTCHSFSEDYDECETCPYNGVIKSPIQLIDPDKTKTQDDGYHYKSVTQSGTINWKPHFPDLVKAFEMEFDYIVDKDSESVFIYKEHKWIEFKKAEINEWSYERMSVIASHPGFNQIQSSEHKAKEFRYRIMARNVIDLNKKLDENSGRINFLNGVYCFKEGFTSHSEKTKRMYFVTCLDFEFDLDATAPKFDLFMNQITCFNKSLKENLLRFAGYAISNSDYIHHKCMILVGDGANGKSTFLNTISEVMSEGSTSHLSLKDMQNEQQRANLRGKLLNFSEETPSNSLGDSSLFKLLTSGGKVQAKTVYQPVFNFKNRAKFMFACNELPKSRDWTTGFRRRIIIVPFDATFRGKAKDNNLEDKLLKERPGIVNMLISAYERLKKDNYFLKTKISDIALEQYEEEFGSSLDFYLGETGFKINFDFEKHELIEDEKNLELYARDMFIDYKAFCEFANERFSFTLRGFSVAFKKYLLRHYDKPTIDSFCVKKRIPGAGRSSSPVNCFTHCLWTPHVKAIESDILGRNNMEYIKGIGYARKIKNPTGPVSESDL